ncbi:MAG: Mur ligase domain-containing protein, partial [Planctomycetota bacterium JB042]
MREEATRVHLIGAAGAGMVALAHLLLDRGARVTATDRTPGAAAARLRERGVDLRAGGAAASLPEDVERVVHSLAVPDDDPQRAAARARGVPDVSYPEAAAALLAERRGVGIAGTHGKTTTSAMVAHGLRRAGAEPSWLVGGEAPDRGRPGGAGDGDLLVVAACEYRSSFLRYRLALGVVLNVEADHLDWFGTEAAVEEAFREFAARAESLVIGAAAATRLGPRGRGRSSTRTFALDGAADVRAAG